MFNYSDNYYLRKKYLESNQTPTQTVIRSKMKDSLAEVYFKSMDSRTRVLAGLEPPLKGGGKDWYQPPEELLAGRSVLKPANKTHLVTLGYNAFDHFAQNIETRRRISFDNWLKAAGDKKDKAWIKYIEHSCKDLMIETGTVEAIANKEKLQRVVTELTCMFTSTLNNLEEIIMNAAKKEVENFRNALYENTVEKHKATVKNQAEQLYNKYENKLKQEKENSKQTFIYSCEQARLKMCNKLHDINIEKHVAIEKLRHLVECRNMACQVYIALKERDECDRRICSSQHKHSKIVKILDDDAEHQHFVIRLEEEKQKEVKKRHNIWKTKVCHTVKNFQSFVEYCLQKLPQHAAFFMNLENVVLMQMSEASENPRAESMFHKEAAPAPRPRPLQPQPHPFRLFCDQGLKPRPDQHLCPKHCTSSASLLPVIVVNSRYFYSACDNLNSFTEKASKYISNQLDVANDMDDIDNNDGFPVTCTLSEQLKELQMESSMMRVLQKDYPNTKNVPIECTCTRCEKPYCFESPPKNEESVIPQSKQTTSIDTSFKLSREMQMMHNRFPTIDSYIDYKWPKRCDCINTYYLDERAEFVKRYPPYMRKTSKFIDDEPLLGKYKVCSLESLKKLMKKGRESPGASTSLTPKVTTKDAFTQYEDVQFETLCKCVSHSQLLKLTDSPRKFQLEVPHDSSLNLSLESFAAKRALTILNLLNDSPELMQIFKSKNCDFDK